MIAGSVAKLEFGGITFQNSATAGNLTNFTNDGLIVFRNISTAGDATITNNGGEASGAEGGITETLNTSTADSATLIAKGGTSGGRGGTILFEDQSTGGTSRVEVFGNGSLDISFTSFPLPIITIEASRWVPSKAMEMSS